MADHFSGPRALTDPACDITDVYAFPSPERPGHLVLMLDVFPAATATALFSDALSYRFRLRPVTATTAGGRPAFVAGAMVDDMLAQATDPDRVLASMQRQIPLGRLCDPAEVAEAVVWLLSDRSAFMTGAEFVLDGGITAG